MASRPSPSLPHPLPLADGRDLPHPLLPPRFRGWGGASHKTCPCASRGVVRIQPHPLPGAPPTCGHTGHLHVPGYSKGEHLDLSDFLFPLLCSVCPWADGPICSTPVLYGLQVLRYTLPLAQACLSTVFTVSLNEQVSSLDAVTYCGLRKPLQRGAWHPHLLQGCVCGSVGNPAAQRAVLTHAARPASSAHVGPRCPTPRLSRGSGVGGQGLSPGVRPVNLSCHMQKGTAVAAGLGSVGDDSSCEA